MNDGGPAFPEPERIREDGTVLDESFGYRNPGMSLRDWFAGQAMGGLLANPDWTENSTSEPDNGSSIPEIAYEVADAMIAARTANPEGGEG